VNNMHYNDGPRAGWLQLGHVNFGTWPATFRSSSPPRSLSLRHLRAVTG
jgi:hypothetical protein